MTVTIRFSNETVKELTHRLRLAIRQLNRPLIRQLSALLLLHDGLDVWSIGARVGVSTTTIYAWRDGFLVKRWASLLRGKSSGRPPKLNPSQLKRLKALVIAGPEAAGYATGCWNAALVQALIAREFGKSFHVNYVSTLLKTWASATRRHASSRTILMKSLASAGENGSGQPFYARRGGKAPCCCLPTRSALPSGARSTIPGLCAVSSRWSRPLASARATR